MYFVGDTEEDMEDYIFVNWNPVVREREVPRPVFLGSKELARQASKKPEPEDIARFAVMWAMMDAHMSQKELARRSGVRESNISRIINGTSCPNVRTLFYLAKGMRKELRIKFE